MASKQPGTLTVEETRANEEAVKHLVRGKYYDFNPPVEATGIPTGGRNVCPETELKKILTFSRGWYIGFVDGNHVFQGKPVDDPRNIPVPHGYECVNEDEVAEVTEPLRNCYFHVYFIGGSAAILSANQDHD